jgi:predicted PilT family ATPase
VHCTGWQRHPKTSAKHCFRRQKFFENFTVVIPSVVRKECDVTKTGREEFESLARFASMGRIKVEYMGRVEDVPSNISSTQRDEMIVDVALKYNAILLTADNSMKLCGLAKGVFTIFI